VIVRRRGIAAGLVSASVLASALAAPTTLLAQETTPAPATPAPAQSTQPAPAPPEPAAPPGPGAPQPALAPIPQAAAPQGVVNEAQPETAPRRDRTRERRRERRRERERAAADADGAQLDPALQDALPAIGAMNVPSFFIETFAVPPFLLSIYQAAGIQYGVRWEVLAAINEIETDYGRNLNVSSAGAMGWMQFIPSSWKAYGVDANQDGKKDPYNPVDAIFAAARYLKAAGADKDLRKAIFAYNHADWYVNSVLERAQLLAALPADLVGALSGLAQGRPPVAGGARPVGRRAKRSRTLMLATRAKAPVVAVTDGEIVRIGRSPRLGRFVRLRDAYGNTYTYGGLGRLARRYPAFDVTARPERPGRSAAAVARRRAEAIAFFARVSRPVAAWPQAPALARLDRAAAAWTARRAADRAPGHLRGRAREQLTASDRRLLGDTGGRAVRYRPLREGSRVVAGTLLARSGAAPSIARGGRLRMEIRPAGRGAPRIDPRPIVAGWKLLHATQPAAAAEPSIGQILLLGKRALERRVLEDPRIELYRCGREDIRAGRIDRRVLATLELLAVSRLRPTVSSLDCGHGRRTSSGAVSEHASGSAVDISAINDVPIRGNQGAGSITEITIRRLLSLQGTVKPHQIISLLTFDGADNTLARADHDDHIHVGFAPERTPSSLAARQFDGVLEPRQWGALMKRLTKIDNPELLRMPSRHATK